ncbi:DivIVA domain-containing protein [Hazenella coriacea]|uniref:DivIVA domain-containing protein n=1 Tax=Hazenella coriacea TaxID=1179467 RepID=A0A4R3L9S4_9BACL|nr:DivIVA domain-containing protein [Hazenella coriacea]TCS96412.1 DivIVA domain-containing protein [Hazenella coriacea]
MPRLTAHQIHSKEFKKVLRGYDINQVNDFLDQIIKDYIEFESNPSSQQKDDKLQHVEHLLEQLMYDIQQLREENRLLREQLERPSPHDPYRNQSFYR